MKLCRENYGNNENGLPWKRPRVCASCRVQLLVDKKNQNGDALQVFMSDDLAKVTQNLVVHMQIRLSSVA